MDDLISRQAAIDTLSMMQGIVNEDGVRKGISKAWQQIKDLPSVQPERKKGKWERHYSRPWERHYPRPNVYADLFWHCSECGYKNENQYADKYHNFCPNCGADMRGENEKPEM